MDEDLVRFDSKKNPLNLAICSGTIDYVFGMDTMWQKFLNNYLSTQLNTNTRFSLSFFY
jgi:hypothetical protein